MKQPNTISISEFQSLAKQGRVGKKRNQDKGQKAKDEMEKIILSFSATFKNEYRFSDRLFKFDWASPAFMLAIEYEGLFSEKSGHTTVTGYTSNCEKYNLACVLGWKVLRYTALNYKDLERDLKLILNL